MFDVIFENVHILFYVNLCFSLLIIILFLLYRHYLPLFCSGFLLIFLLFLPFPSLLYVFNLLVSLLFILHNLYPTLHLISFFSYFRRYFSFFSDQCFIFSSLYNTFLYIYTKLTAIILYMYTHRQNELDIGKF
uniref:Uncharacterized protein n=1 Tax=Cacopsylla melanoneura TaxID=428564 RepID=A0A8D8YQ40_9HEMI